MKNLNILYIVLFLTVYSPRVEAQKLDLSNFLLDVCLGNYPIGSSIKDLKVKPNLDRIGNGLSFYSCVELIPGEILGFGIVRQLHLIVKNDTIKKVEFSLIMDPDTYKGFTNAIINIYEKPTTIEKDYSQITKWKRENFELSIKYYPGSMTFNVEFGNEVIPIIPPKKWIYSERKGKGMSKLMLNLKYFETLANSNLTSSQFESLMPEWFTSGLENSLLYSYNEITKNHDIPKYSISYEAITTSNKYFASINTKDTLEKKISSYNFSRINNQAIITTLKTDLRNMGYKIDTYTMLQKRKITGITSDETIYANNPKGISLSIGKTVGGYYINFFKITD